MEFIRTIRERQQTKRQAEIERQAEELITLQDFNDSLYIAYRRIPLAPIDPAWTTKEIVQQLSVFRTNFINSRMKDTGANRIAATF